MFRAKFCQLCILCLKKIKSVVFFLTKFSLSHSLVSTVLVSYSDFNRCAWGQSSDEKTLLNLSRIASTHVLVYNNGIQLQRNRISCCKACRLNFFYLMAGHSTGILGCRYPPSRQKKKKKKKKKKEEDWREVFFFWHTVIILFPSWQNEHIIGTECSNEHD